MQKAALQQESHHGYLDRMTNYVIKGNATTKALDIYHLIFAPTYACNLRCRHCYLPDHGSDMIPKQKTLEIVKEWTQIVLAERGQFRGIFHFKGGEPFCLDYLTEVLYKIASDGLLAVMITTNGTACSEHQLAALAECNLALKQNMVLNVSLEGTTEKTHSLLRGEGNFTKTLSFVRQARKLDITVHLNCVTTKHNIDDISTLVDFANTEGVSQVNFLPFMPRGYGKEIWDWATDPVDVYERLTYVYAQGDERTKMILSGTYPNIFEKEAAGEPTSNECIAGYTGLLYVVPNGDVFSCPNLVNRSLRIGNIHRTSLGELHQTVQARVYPKTCEDEPCTSRYICKGESLLGGAPNKIKARADRLRQFQSTLVADSPDSVSSIPAMGTSYCYSRNL